MLGRQRVFRPPPRRWERAVGVSRRVLVPPQQHRQPVRDRPASIVEVATQQQPHERQPAGGELNRLAFSATVHCLTGCAIGEVLGMILSTWWGWGNFASIVLAIVLAFFFGYSLTIGPVLRAGVPFRRALPVAFASDTALISVMEIADNAFILIVPGAIDAELG